MSATSDSRSTFDGVSVPTDRRSAVRFARPELAVAIVTWTLLSLLEHCVPAEAGEPLALRWLRTASEHPLRMSLAAAIAMYGLFGSGRACRTGPPDEGARKNP
jgi:hypothetical protein